MDHSNFDSLLGAIHKDFGDDAVAGELVAAQFGVEVRIVVGLVVDQLIVGEALDLLTVHIDRPIIILSGSLAHGIVEILAGHFGGKGVVSLVRISAHLFGLILPDVGGTAEIVLVLILRQIALIQLFAQFHDGAGGVGAIGIGSQLIVDCIGVVLTAGHILVGDAAGDSDVAHRDVLAGLLSLNRAGLQSVQDQLGQVVAGHGLTHAGVHIVKQVDLVALRDSGQLPVASKVAAVLEVAQSLQQHQSRLGGGHVFASAISGGAGAGGDAVGPAGSHIGLRPRGHVGKGAGVFVGGHVVSHQIGHDNGHLVAGDFLVGVEVAGLVTNHDANRLEHFNGFHVVGVGHIRVAAARGAGAHHHQAGNHGRGETQAESTLQVSHWNSSF